MGNLLTSPTGWLDELPHQPPRTCAVRSSRYIDEMLAQYNTLSEIVSVMLRRNVRITLCGVLRRGVVCSISFML